MPDVNLKDKHTCFYCVTLLVLTATVRCLRYYFVKQLYLCFVAVNVKATFDTVNAFSAEDLLMVHAAPKPTGTLHVH